MRSRYLIPILLLAMAGTGCGSKKSSLLLDRQAVGPLEEEARVAAHIQWRLEPTMQTQEQEGVELAVHQASQEYLTNLFLNKQIFGEFTGKSPFTSEHLVFYVKMANRSPNKIHLSAASFVLLDDRGNQYHTLGVDPLTALAEARRAWGTARGVLSEARPGYFGIGIPVGRLFTAGGQREFALLKQASLQSGFVYPGVVHDGLVAFWSPHPEAKQLRLILADIKAEFDPNDEPRASFDFPFEFTVSK